MLIKFDSIQKANEGRKEYNEGRYDVKITKVENKVSQSGNEYIRITYETIGENIFSINANYFPNSEKALSIFLNILSAIGLYDSNSKGDLNISNDDLLGNLLSIELVKGEEQDNGMRYLECRPWSAKPVSDDILPF